MPTIRQIVNSFVKKASKETETASIKSIQKDFQKALVKKTTIKKK